MSTEGDASAEVDGLLWELSEAQLKHRFGSSDEAALRVFRHAIGSLKIRVWVEEGPNWKRPTLPRILELLPPSSGLYVDYEEVRRVLGSRWPTSFPSTDKHAAASQRLALENWVPKAGPATHGSPKAAKGKPGPKKGPGYSTKDVPLFEIILAAQRESGDVETQYALVRKFAPKDAYYSSHVERLRKGLKIWLGENGHNWQPSK